MTPRLLEVLSGRRVTHAAAWEAEIVSIGSVLEPWFWPPEQREKYAGVIWGSGRLVAQEPISFPNATVTALRGPLSKPTVEAPGASDAALGDPGLLANLLVERAKPQWKLGVFPHFTHLRDPGIHRLATSSPTVCLIDPLDDPLSVLAKVARCETIAASALHGLIVADALGLRRIWIDPTPADSRSHTRETVFKFRDYFASIGDAPAGPRHVAGDEEPQALAKEASVASVAEVESRRRDLLAAFPFAR